MFVCTVEQLSRRRRRRPVRDERDGHLWTGAVPGHQTATCGHFSPASQVSRATRTSATATRTSQRLPVALLATLPTAGIALLTIGLLPELLRRLRRRRRRRQIWRLRRRRLRRRIWRRILAETASSSSSSRTFGVAGRSRRPT